MVTSAADFLLPVPPLNQSSNRCPQYNVAIRSQYALVSKESRPTQFCC